MIANGVAVRRRPQLSDSIDKLDSMIDKLADAIPPAVADAVKDTLASVVREAVRQAVAELAKQVPAPAPVAPAPPVDRWATVKALIATMRVTASRVIGEVKAVGRWVIHQVRLRVRRLFTPVAIGLAVAKVMGGQRPSLSMAAVSASCGLAAGVGIYLLDPVIAAAATATLVTGMALLVAWLAPVARVVGRMIPRM